MTKEKKFEELLGEAPLATDEDTVTLVGAVHRSQDPKKFVLMLGAGNSVTLDIAAVKEHQVLGGMVGQPLVRLKVDRKKVPDNLPPVDSRAAFTNFIADYGIAQTLPGAENIPVYGGTLQETIYGGGTLQENIGLGWNDPSLGGGVYYGGAVTPFALATPHHVSQAVAARMMPGVGAQFSVIGHEQTLPTVPQLDAGIKTATNPAYGDPITEYTLGHGWDNWW